MEIIARVCTRCRAGGVGGPPESSSSGGNGNGSPVYAHTVQDRRYSSGIGGPPGAQPWPRDAMYGALLLVLPPCFGQVRKEGAPEGISSNTPSRSSRRIFSKYVACTHIRR